MRPLVCFNPPIRRCTPCSKHFFLVPMLSNVIALAPWPLSALCTLNSLLFKVRHVPPCRYEHTTVCMSLESWHTGHRTTVSYLLNNLGMTARAQASCHGRGK